ncbi:K+/H+ antiporter subunit F [Advenella sp. RU8]|uniref:K+/H+ antiporter subunit F n=1 Tax=Advenella sp. RU8 TaxID=3399575 RepID=UPI003AAD3D2D
MNLILTWACYFAICCFSLALFCAFIRLVNGPTPQDRVLGLDIMYINGMLLIIVLGMLYRTSWYFDIALLISLLGFVSSSALSKFLLRGEVIEP